MNQSTPAEHLSTLALLSALKENITQGVAIFDREQHLLEWNSRYADLRGIDPSKLHKNKPLREITQEGSALVVDGGSFDFSRFDVPFAIHVYRQDGIVLEIRGQPISEQAYMFMYTDVTAVRHSELAFRDQATRLTAILDNVVDAIVTINESGSIESWSKGAQRMFGYEAHEVLRRNVRMLMPEPHASAHDGYLRRYMQTGEKRIMGARREVEAKRKNGSSFSVDLGISEMRFAERRLFIGIIRDITERKQIEQMKNEFISTVSHELRTPLTSIAGSLGLVAGGATGPLTHKAERLVSIARSNCDRLVRLINDILDIEKAQAGRLDLQLVKQPLAPIVQHAIEINGPFAHGYGAEIQLTAPSEEISVLVDRDRLTQVLTNLLSNAAKYSPRGGLIAVEVQLQTDEVIVKVADQGPGIPHEFQRRLFERFAQADGSDSRAKGGTGLGLSIVKTMMEHLGGTVRFTSEPGRGTEFQIGLPLCRDPVDVSPEAPDVISGSHHVLVCEDDPDVGVVLAEILRRAGMTAHITSTALAARATLERIQIDFAIIDVHLPDADGLGLVKELRERSDTRDLPMLVLSGVRAADVMTADQLRALHLVDWVQKPLNPKKLLETIRTALS